MQKKVEEKKNQEVAEELDPNWENLNQEEYEKVLEIVRGKNVMIEETINIEVAGSFDKKDKEHYKEDKKWDEYEEDNKQQNNEFQEDKYNEYIGKNDDNYETPEKTSVKEPILNENTSTIREWNFEEEKQLQSIDNFSKLF